MIVFPDQRLILLTPPHTASGHLHDYYCRPPSPVPAFWVIGRPLDSVDYWDHHVCRIAPGFDRYRVLVVWRNPEARLVGLYEHHQYWHENGPANAKLFPRLSFPEYVALVAKQSPKLTWLHKYTIARLLRDNSVRPHGLVDFDDLEATLERETCHPCTLKQPNTEHAPPAEYWTDETRATAARWFQDEHNLHTALTRQKYGTPRP
jgi:hypothetical protein